MLQKYRSPFDPTQRKRVAHDAREEIKEVQHQHGNRGFDQHVSFRDTTSVRHIQKKEKTQTTDTKRVRPAHLLLLAVALAAGLGVRVDTIWQCTVPRSSMSQNAPNTSVPGISCGCEMLKNNTVASTRTQGTSKHTVRVFLSHAL